ncbi:hypothetical protein H2202_009467 [Exophiala xenobiotica]|nr:hypothetical protein H2202_009467 [Exophiala xenobiotica]KAK5229735.1 hypothetical protein LTR72_001267 [Exophiala xenobiotica]KAK5492115.1 hypothetical protein LTR55_003467 [Exophiala xenobiotica]
MRVINNAERLSRFFKAMEMYSPFPASDDPTLSEWIPPPLLEAHRGRYLWTDGFGVVNFLTLYKITREDRYLIFARNLIFTVHNVLGYTRDGKERLPGATEERPLDGGLRIGKCDETGPDGDGQYFHYLTMWMHALNRMTFVTGNKWYNDQAVSMAKAVLFRFMTNVSAERPRMVWKLSIDLSQPIVDSEGNLDPIDGYVTYTRLQETSDDHHVLDEELAALKKIVDDKVEDYSSLDTLDLGMTLWTLHWLVPQPTWPLSGLWPAKLQYRVFDLLLIAAKKFDLFNLPHEKRLAFREFGAALGLRTAVPLIDKMLEHHTSLNPGDLETIARLNAFKAMPDRILHNWEEAGLLPRLTEQLSGREAELISTTIVMYATALIPGMMIRQP